MLKSLLKSKFMIMPIAAGAAALAVAVPAAANNWGASQTGVRQGGSADAAVIQIQVEAGLPASASLLPDEPGCSFGGTTQPGCEGVPVSVTVRNLTGQWLRLGQTSQALANPACVVAPPTFFCATAPIASDRVDTGQWLLDIGTYAGSGSGANCGTYGLFLPAPTYFFGTGNGFKALPTIPPHGSLSLPTADGRSLGALHLSSSTPNTCQGASFRVPLTVTATPVAS